MKLPPGRWGAYLIPLLALSAGCSSLTGGKGSPFAPSHHLTDAAKDLRLANAGARAVPRELEKQPLPSYIVEPGDVLLVTPADIDSPVRLPGDQPVLPDGTINLGKYGHLLIAGKTVPEIEDMVKAAVEAKTKDPGFINVRLVSRQTKVYYVIGEVNAPGAFQMSGRETVLDAILAAGGLTDRASSSNIILSRPSKPNECRTVLPVCWKNIVQLGDTTTNYQIAPGDRIYVPGQCWLEQLTGGHCDKSPCKGGHCPTSLPPYAGAACEHAPALPPPLAAPPALPLMPEALPEPAGARFRTTRRSAEK
ncbi:MAG: polysaccharide biosynthesis/export family protein [Gemmataceae bacterium]